MHPKCLIQIVIAEQSINQSINPSVIRSLVLNFNNRILQIQQISIYFSDFIQKIVACKRQLTKKFNRKTFFSPTPKHFYLEIMRPTHSEHIFILFDHMKLAIGKGILKHMHMHIGASKHLLINNILARYYVCRCLRLSKTIARDGKDLFVFRQKETIFQNHFRFVGITRYKASIYRHQ